MAFAINSRRALVAALVIAATSLMLFYGNGLNPWWPLMWFAPLPVLLYAPRNPGWAVAITAFLSWLIGALNMHHYFSLLQIPWLTVYASVALVFTAGVMLFRGLVRGGAPWSALLAFPALWVSFEYALDRLGSGGTAGSLSYSQLHFLPFLQLASVTGPWGMSFLLLLFPAAFAVGFHLRSTAPKQGLAIVGTSLGILVLVLIFGVVRLSQPSPGPHEKVGLIASDSSGNDDVASAGADSARLFHAYAAAAEKLAAAGALIIVLPEKLGVVVDPNTSATDAIFQSLSDKTGDTIVAGMVRVSPPLKYNEARIYQPDAPPLSYDKRHMLPPFESMFKPGTTLAFLHRPTATWGVAICKDMDFARPARLYGESGVGLMLVPAWDFNLDRAWHGHIAIMRGVEDGFSIVRAAKNGYLTVSDDRGRILAETRSDSAPFATLVAAVPAVHDATLYLLLGDWFAWFALAVLAVMLVRLFLIRGMILDRKKKGQLKSA
jgi:apolipoprotein N-acyltransferase